MQENKRETNKFYKNKSFLFSLILICSVIVGMLFLNLLMIHRTKTTRMMSEGQIQMTNITSEVESNLYKAECMVESMASYLEQLLAEDEPAEKQIWKFVVQQQRQVQDKTEGQCFATYVARKERLYMQGFIPGKDWVLSERSWYVGAKKKNGKTFISEPYVDANTGKMCYSVSKVLSDGETVVSVDYYMDQIQTFIEEMNEENGGISLIVNQNGMIVGHSDPAYIGREYQSLPYSDIVKKTFSLYGDSFVYRSNGIAYNVFSDKTLYDWYLIVCVKAQHKGAVVTMEYIWVIGIIVLLAILLIVFFVRDYRDKFDFGIRLKIKESKMETIEKAWEKFQSEILNQTHFGDDSDWRTNNVIEKIQTVTEQMSTTMSTMLNAPETEQVMDAEEFETDNHKSKFIVIVSIIAVAGLFALAINTYTQIRWSNTKMQNEMKDYYYQTKDWVTENKQLVDTLTRTIAINPKCVEDYRGCVKYLNDMISGYEDISVAYLVNPEWEHTVIMNNGWEPPENWKVEERPWYQETLNSTQDNGFNVSKPYLDEQTGLYCVTLSQIVYDNKGNRIGLIGIDYYMDQLIDILGESFSDNGYAFLVDMNYNILNHPDETYQMTKEIAINAGDLSYRKILTSDRETILKDYDGKYRLCMKQEEEISGFTVIVLKSLWVMYRDMIVTNLLLFLLFFACIVIVIIIMNKLNSVQEKINFELKLSAEQSSAASKAKSDFLAQMSHEIRTPINAVLGMNEMILRESEDRDILEYAANIQSAGRTLLNLINSILDFSKIEDGKMEIVNVEYDTSSMINDLVQMVFRRAEKKNLLLHFDVDSNLPKTLFGDDVRIRQVITNLLTNAVKYTQEGSVTFTIRGEREEENDEILLYVEVKDTGIGIKEEDIEKLFQSFQRLDLKKNRNVEGTGLGISIVQRLLSLMDSSLQVHSVYGKGSVFSFTLKQRIVDATPIGNYKEQLERSKTQSKKDTFLYAPQADILVVDDYPVNLKVASGLMKRCGIVPVTVTSGKQCLEIVKTQHFDIIFLDHMMPEMDGIETLKALQENGDLPDSTKVIMMTANAISGAREQYLGLGFHEYLTKPIEIERLEKILQHFIPKEKVSFKSILAEQVSEGKENREEQERHDVETEEEIHIPEHEDESTKEESGMGEDAFSAQELQELSELIPELSVKEGLTYCMDSKSFYLEILEDFTAENKEEVLSEYLQNGDMKNYAVVVHSLKGVAKTIGCESLYDKTFALQQASEEEDNDFVAANHAEAMDLYVSLKEKITAYLNKE